VIASLLLACSNDFGLERVQGFVPAGDTGEGRDPDAEAAGDDTAAPADTAEPLDSEPEEVPPEDTSPPVDTGAVEEPAPEDDCDHTSDLVYALSRDDRKLYTFDPASRAFAELGEIDCPTSQDPASMAVDRTGTAWVRFGDDSVWEVNLTTFRCDATTYDSRRNGFGSFGMGYATDSKGGWQDQLYVANDDTLAVLDPASWTLGVLGSMPSQSELTGNADGELWAILPLERTARLVQLDKSTGAELGRISLPGFPDPSGIDTFAFATWDGAFYLFVREHGMGESTSVYEVERDGTMTRIVSDSGLNVVGAGVSTCAPA